MRNNEKSKGEHAHIRVPFEKRRIKFNWNIFNKKQTNYPYDYIFATKDMDVLDMKATPNDWVTTADDDPPVRQDGKFTVIL